MNSDEWLGIVAWVNQRVDRSWTVDQAARLGLALKSYEAEAVRGALSRLLTRDTPTTLANIKRELRKPSSKYAGLLESKHRELYPRGCPNRTCDVCVDIRPKAV